MNSFELFILFTVSVLIGNSNSQVVTPLISPKTARLLREYKRKVAQSRGEVVGDLSPETLGRSLSTNDDGTELSKNAAIAGFVLDGDIVPTEQQIKLLLQDVPQTGTSRQNRRRGGRNRLFRFSRPEPRREKRKIDRLAARWPRNIPYIINIADGNYQRIILEGIKQWEADTCLRFQRLSSTAGNAMVFMQGGGCYSGVGMVGAAPQHVSIGNGCGTKGIVMHEIGHALGLWHEQSRSIRDTFVKILWGNIIKDTSYNFQTKTASSVLDFGVPYDLGSVMHYGPKGFTIRWDLNVIETKNPNYQNTIGQRHSASFTDVKVINKAYCSGVCRANLPCEKGGYPDPNNCRICKCPAGFGGTYCNQVAPSVAKWKGSVTLVGRCGGVITATQSWQTMNSPPSQPNQDCIWRIRSNNGGKVYFKIASIDYPIQHVTCLNFVEVKYGPDFQSAGPRFCKATPTTNMGWSSSDEIIVIHHTDSGSHNPFSGFRAQFLAENKPGPRTVKETTHAPTRPPTTTTRRTTRAPSRWAAWSTWSGCSRTCGGCGRARRTRKCGGGGTCAGKAEEVKNCMTIPCKTFRGNVPKQECEILLKIPCGQVLTVTTFTPNTAAFKIEGLPSNFPKNKKLTLKNENRIDGIRGGWDRKKRQIRTDPNSMCSRDFHYDCTEKNVVETCCQGYRLTTNRGTCVKSHTTG